MNLCTCRSRNVKGKRYGSVRPRMLLEVLEYFYRVDALRCPHNKDELLRGCGKQTRIFETAPQAGNLNSPWQRRVE